MKKKSKSKSKSYAGKRAYDSVSKEQRKYVMELKKAFATIHRALDAGATEK